MNSYYSQLQQALDSINLMMKPRIAMIIGSGLAALLSDAKIVQRIPYHDIEGFPRTSAPSHKGELLLALFAGCPVLVFNGRVHLYEGKSAQDVVLPVYLASLLGIDKLIITNAAGGLNADFAVGDVMVCADHINLTGVDPTTGLNDDWLGSRFTDMSQAYCSELRDKWQAVCARASVSTHTGIYCGVHGPALETSAERRMMRLMGADAVGMSTVLETIAANHSGIKVIALSAITNMALGDENQQADTIDDVIAGASLAAEAMARVLHDYMVEIQ